MRWYKKIGIGLLVALLGIVATAISVFAIAEPTNVSLDDTTLFQDLITDGDILAVVPYEINFTTAPDEPVDETFIFRLLSPDGSTENGTALASALYNSGYGKGLVSFYFESGMTWGSAYIFRVQQNPVLYPAAQKWDFTADNASYSAATDQAAALKVKILDIADELTPEFGVALTTTSESGNRVLSAYGELYFLDAILGLQTMCPDLFQVQLESPDFSKRTWSTTFADNLKTKYYGTFIYDFMTGSGELWSTTPSATMTVLSIFLAVILIGFSVWKGKASMIAAASDGYCLLLLLMLEGFFPMVAAGAVAFCSTALGGVILFLNRS